MSNYLKKLAYVKEAMKKMASEDIYPQGIIGDSVGPNIKVPNIQPTPPAQLPPKVRVPQERKPEDRIQDPDIRSYNFDNMIRAGKNKLALSNRSDALNRANVGPTVEQLKNSINDRYPKYNPIPWRTGQPWYNTPSWSGSRPNYNPLPLVGGSSSVQPAGPDSEDIYPSGIIGNGEGMKINVPELKPSTPQSYATSSNNPTNLVNDYRAYLGAFMNRLFHRQ